MKREIKLQRKSMFVKKNFLFSIDKIKITIGIVGMCSNPFIILNPSTAEDTETGGVMIPSAKRAEAPIIVGRIKFFPFLLIKEYKEKIPPSPSLSAFRVNHTYLIEVWKNKVQKTQETPP